MEDFDALALKWDREPRRIQRAKEVADRIIHLIPDLDGMEGFEYGCGTGLLSFQLQPYIKNIWLADRSEGMLSVLEQKIEKGGVSNMHPMNVDLTVDKLPDAQYDLIYTLMTLHHIAGIDAIIKTFYDLLKPQGYVCIADLEKEDGTFHSADFQGHHGFDRADLSQRLIQSGFQKIRSEMCHQITKVGSDGIEKVYPVFLMIGQKN